MYAPMVVMVSVMFTDSIADLYARGGLHDVLYLLKGFDLDIRREYPLGTVFCYERSDMFKDLKYLSL